MYDVRYALRVLRKNSGFTAAAVLTLALGIGLNATIFSIFDAVALRRVQIRGAAPAISIYQEFRGRYSRDVYGSANLFSYPEFQLYRAENGVFSDLTAYMPEFSALLGSDPQPVHGQLTACNYFDVLDARPALGRGFVPAECAADAAGPVVVLSDALWRNRFSANPAIVGTVVRLNRVALTVIGVAPRGFGGTEIVVPSFWVPVSMQSTLAERPQDESFLRKENVSWLAMVGRLKSGVTLDRARASLGVIAARLDAKNPGRSTRLSVAPTGFFSQPDKHRVVVAVGAVFMVAVGLVLLIACANLANLFLARALSREREIAVRLALGASRLRLVRQLMTESLLVAVAGTALGTLLALWSAAAIVKVVVRDQTSTPVSITIIPNLHLLIYATLLAGVTAVAFGLTPALQATRPDLNRSLKGGGERSGSDSGRTWLRNSLVGIQVTVCMILLITAGLLLRGLDHAETIDPGFSLDNTMTMSIDLAREGYTQAQAAAFHRGLLDRIRSLPGVDAAAEGEAAPLGGRHHFSPFKVPGGVAHQNELDEVTPGFLTTIGIPLARGRDFDRAVVAAGGRQAILNEAAARLYFPGENPVGRVLRDARDHDYQVVGVVRDAPFGDLGKEHTPYIFLSATSSDALDLTTVVVHSSAPFGAVAGALRGAALSLDRDLHLSVNPLRDNMRPYLQASRILASLSSVLGALALLLASIGIYGTVAFSVARRTREIGIRVALGARSSGVISLIVGQAMRPVAIGAVVGTAACAGLSRVLAPVLFGISPLDATAFAAVPVFLLSVGLVASYLPARRAAGVDAMAALRAE